MSSDVCMTKLCQYRYSQ